MPLARRAVAGPTEPPAGAGTEGAAEPAAGPDGSAEAGLWNAGKREFADDPALAMYQDFPLAHMWAAARSLRFADGPDEVHKRSLARRELRRYTR